MPDASQQGVHFHPHALQPRDVPSAIQRLEEKRMHTMLVKENTDRIPGNESLQGRRTSPNRRSQVGIGM